ncbi:hypothetical protein KSP39_PZI012755 [Platanthera zijinensis]|uniref:Uncharacterized protein n=1 Tax=Platanthera zijinensis TaxID=2320716 RepID=A0AAP0BGR1_9ASPA
MATSHSGDFPASPIPFSTLRQSNRSLRTLFGTVDDTNGERKSEPILTFFPHDEKGTQCQNGALSPLPSPALKLPPRLQAAGSEAPSPRSPRMPASSPKPLRKVSALSKWKDFDPFQAAVERIRKDDATVLKPFYWRALERSFEQSFIRVMEDGEEGECEYWDFEGSSQTIVCASRKQKWNPLSCLGSQ